MKSLPATPPQNRSPSLWDPFSSFAEMRRQMDEFMSGVIEQQRVGNTGWRPAIDVDEDDRGFAIHIAVPGWAEQDVAVEVDRNILTIRGQRGGEGTSSTAGERSSTGRWSGSFIQSLSLPATIDTEHITAHLDKGLLTVQLPKQPQATPKRIAVSAAAPTPAREPAGG